MKGSSKAALIACLLWAAPVAAQRHRHRPVPWSRQCRGFDICDGRLRQDIYDRSFGPGNVLELWGADWRGEPLAPGSKFKVNNYWFEVIGPEPAAMPVLCTIQWMGGYFIVAPGVHVAIKVL